MAERRSSVFATYHGKKDGTDLRRRYYEDRRRNFPPDHERDPSKAYGDGWKRYAFAAPFTPRGEEWRPTAAAINAPRCSVGFEIRGRTGEL